MKIFVTGGAGYIGSHVVKMLGEQGVDMLVYDNLSTGHEDSVLYGRLVVADLQDETKLKEVMLNFRPDAVMHFAASIRVDESVSNPLKYYKNNTCNTLNLIKAMTACGVNKFIFSSSAAVYGTPATMPVKEDNELKPISAYGYSKMFTEIILQDISRASDFNYISLRYFNVAGADRETKIGQKYADPTHLITRALKAARGLLPKLQIYGTDYPTHDGTCIRDYVHVSDLAEAHVLCLDHLVRGGKSDVFNLGYNSGYSVQEVIDVVKKVTKVDFPVEKILRRQGDSSILIADSNKIQKQLGWNPHYNDLEYIVKTAWNWERRLGAM